MTKARNIAELANDISVDSNRDVTLSNLRSDQPMMFRNRIINGNFDIWQRGTSQTSNGYGSADRWRSFASGSTLTASQQSFTLGQTDVPGNPKYYFRYVVSSVSGSGNSGRLMQRIEDVSSLAGQTVTLSFWAKADSNKNIATEFLQNFGSGGSPSATVTTIGVTTHNLTTSWQKFTATFSIPSISGKTIGSNNNDYSRLSFWFDAGSDWNSRTNSLGQQSGTFDIAQIQLEEGTVPTPFEHRPYGTELALCQRYCVVWKDNSHIGTGTAYNATSMNITVPVPVPMRATPSPSKTTAPSGNWLYVYVGAVGQFSNSTPEVGESGIGCYRIYTPSSGSNWTVGQGSWCQVIDDATFTLSAEL